MTKTIFLLPRDGIGPEVLGEASRVLDVLRHDRGLDVRTHSDYLGGAAIARYSVSLAAETLAKAPESALVIMGSVGGPQWSRSSDEHRPEQWLLSLRKGLGLFANFRPARCFPALSDASTLKLKFVERLDIMIMRELTGGVHFGEPHGIRLLPDGPTEGIEYPALLELGDPAYCRRRVPSGTAAWQTGLLGRKKQCHGVRTVVAGRGDSAAHGPVSGRQAQPHLLDNCAMQLVKFPKQFEVMLTDNLFGDLLSEEAAMLTGSLSMLPSASIGKWDQLGLYDPIHGAAPDIAGKGIANPCAAVLSLAMALRTQLQREDLATRIEAAVSSALNVGYRTRDLPMGNAAKVVRPRGMGDAILESL